MQAHRLVFACVCLLGACVVQAATHQVQVVDSAFQPQELHIQPGDTVTWVHAAGLMPHDVRADDGSYTSGAPSAAAWQFSRVFQQPGEYRYYCTVHGAPGGIGMSGKIRVEAQEDFGINRTLGGTWYDPATSGQGAFIEVLEELGLTVIAWFTWMPQGGQLWLTGVGEYEGRTATLAIEHTRGGRFDDPAPVTRNDAGTAVLTFEDCSHATLQYNLTDPVVNGTLNWVRLTPGLPGCIDPPDDDPEEPEEPPYYPPGPG